MRNILVILAVLGCIRMFVALEVSHAHRPRTPTGPTRQSATAGTGLCERTNTTFGLCAHTNRPLTPSSLTEPDRRPLTTAGPAIEVPRRTPGRLADPCRRLVPDSRCLT